MRGCLMDEFGEKPPAGRFIDDYLLYQLAVASHHLSAEFHLYVKKQGVKIYVWRVLASLIDHPGLMLTKLSRLVLIEQSRLTKIIDQMHKDGLILKQTDPKDRRRALLSVSDKGAKLAQGLIIEAKRHEQAALQGLTKRERESFKAILRKLGPKTDSP